MRDYWVKSPDRHRQICAIGRQFGREELLRQTVSELVEVCELRFMGRERLGSDRGAGADCPLDGLGEDGLKAGECQPRSLSIEELVAFSSSSRAGDSGIGQPRTTRGREMMLARLCFEVLQ